MLFLGVVIGIAEPSTPGIDGIPFPEKSKILTALRVEDPEERREAVDKALFEVLVLGDYHTCIAARLFIVKLTRWYDFRPHEQVFREVAQTHGGCSFLSILDMQDVQLAPRQERLDLLRRILLDGEVQLRRGTVLGRSNAIIWVCNEGMSSLLPLAEKNYSELGNAMKSSCSREKLRLECELKSGAENRGDALVRAADALLRMDPSELEERANESTVFEDLIAQYAKSACEENPIDHMSSPACGTFGSLWDRESQRLTKSEQSESELPMWLQTVGYVVNKERHTKPVTDE
jgi:hypothetical protein